MFYISASQYLRILPEHDIASGFCSARRLVAAIFIMLFLPWSSQAQATMSEHDLKAAFAYSCALYTDWPALPASANMNICTNADDLFSALNNLTVKSVRGRSIVPQLLSQANLSRCHVLLIDNNSDPGYWEGIKSQLGAASTLTIVDSNTSNYTGAIIGFRMGSDKIVFKIDRDVAGQAKLTLRSEMLSLAKAMP